MSAVDVEGLFKQFTIKEIREIEKRAKGDVEQKKEDLRQMVGRRYRDIIDAADTIRDMTFISEAIVKSIREVQSSCDKLQGLHNHMIVNQHSSQSKRSGPVDNESSLDAQIKLFSDLSELIYECLQDGDYALVLDGAYLYHLGEHLYHRLCLHLPAEENGAPSKKRILLDKLWPPIKQLRPIILEESRNVLSSWVVLSCNESGLMAIKEAACAILLLESTSINETLKIVLQCREDAIVKSFSSDDSSREQICMSLSILQHTLIDVQQLFTLNSTNTNCALVQLINQVMQGKWNSKVFTTYLDCQIRLFSNYLPSEIKNFTMRSSATVMDIDKESLNICVSAWLKNCLEICRSQCQNGLHFCESIQSLSSLKKSIIASIENTSVSEAWRSACLQIVGEELSLWQVSLSDVIQSRLQTISTETIIVGFDQLKLSLDNKNEFQFTCDLSSFVWQKELPSDVPAVIAPTLSTLPLKARGLAPQIFQLINRLDEHLEKVHKGIDAHMKLSAQMDNTVEDTVYRTLADCLVSEIEKLSQWIKITLEHVKNVQNEGKMSQTAFDSCIRLSQTCCCIVELCPQLKQILSWQPQEINNRGRRVLETESWTKARDLLQESSVLALKFWLEHRVLMSIEVWKEFENVENVEDVDWLEEMVEWEDIQLEEENEVGDKVNSQLHVPRQVSRYMHHFLLSINAALASIASYRVPKPAHQYVIMLASSRIIQFIGRFVIKRSKDLPQRIAVQLLFDLRFAITILVSKLKEDNNAELSHNLSKDLELLIDPFDLDLLAPHIRKNINKLVAKSLTLYGSVILPEVSLNLSRSVKSSSSSSDPAQILPLAVSVPRFLLLPISTNQSLNSSLDAKPLMQLQSTPNLQAMKAKSGTAQKMSVSSFYDKISTSWFGM